MKLYHATYKAYLDSILKLGLGALQFKNWDFSEDGLVYLARCSYEAESFAECADEIDDSIYNSGIVVLEIDVDQLDSRLGADPNNAGNTMTFSGIIPAEYICIKELEK